MEHDELQKSLWKINRAQILEMEKHKWIESEKVGYDLGQKAVFDWIDRFSGPFRHYWTQNISN